jgi:putative MATE family efflux protein
LEELSDSLLEPNPARHPLSNRELHHLVWRLSWPSVMTMLLQTINSLMDAFFVGHLPGIGGQALAATSAGGNVLFIMFSLAMGVSVGTTALVARFTGAGDHEQTLHTTAQSITLSALVGLLCAAPAWFGRDLIIILLLNPQQNPEAAALCSQFLAMALLSVAPMFVMNALGAVFRGLGDTRTPLYLTIVAVSTHISLNALLINGRLGFPAMGVRGAGLAMTLSVVVVTLLFFVALVRRTALGGALCTKHLRLQLKWAQRILKIGIPASVQGLLRSLSMTSFTGMLAHAPQGAAAVAALGIGMRAEAFSFMPGFGYGIAASALVGQNLGAKSPEQAERSAWAATHQAMVIMSLMGVVFLAFSHLLPLIFTRDAVVVALSADYLRISAFGEPFLAIGMVLTNALQGAGETVRPTYITFITMWVVRLPLTYFLMFPLRLYTHGAWFAMLITTVLGGLMTLQLFRSGRWKRIKV